MSPFLAQGSVRHRRRRPRVARGTTLESRSISASDDDDDDDAFIGDVHTLSNDEHGVLPARNASQVLVEHAFELRSQRGRRLDTRLPCARTLLDSLEPSHTTPRFPSSHPVMAHRPRSGPRRMPLRLCPLRPARRRPRLHAAVPLLQSVSLHTPSSASLDASDPPLRHSLLARSRLALAVVSAHAIARPLCIPSFYTPPHTPCSRPLREREVHSVDVPVSTQIHLLSTMSHLVRLPCAPLCVTTRACARLR